MNSDGRNVNSNTGALCMYSVLHPSESSFPREYLWHIIHTKALTSPNFVIVKDPSADVSYTSCDGITFRLHSDHVKVNAADMPLPDSKSKNLNSEAAAIALEETSEVLDALFQFIQPPSKTGKTRGIMCTIFSNEKFEGSLLLELIKAAEKYGVNSALDACLVRLDQLVEREPDKNTLEIVNLADKYGYTDILDKVAEVALSLPLDEVLVDAFSNPGLLQRFVSS
ncbi:hypothetical protein CPB83DRAFT_852141 [Crepidotus variabilis]|uniref:BTB domain-containing protein n=1 Tax=Crepidotus variabilis TaxID=179855 RepID=A0A9P6EIZ1_9AGAR|nr:hypothetical protein CPB83DRAFT_852141 [Crepidotus variabilis]